MIFEKTLLLEEVIEDWEKANVIPIFKKSKKENLRNYMLVSLTSDQKNMMEIILQIDMIWSSQPWIYKWEVTHSHQ